MQSEIFLIILGISIAYGSIGDRSQFFINCQKKCIKNNCTEDGINFKTYNTKFYQQSLMDHLLFWSCLDECKYDCMWHTVNAFLERKWNVPQFHGKWPFIKFLGLQEPASAIFSMMNFLAHVYQLRKFRKKVRPDSPCYILWHCFSIVCLHGWIWSTIFHARDFPLTELLDYASAYSIVLVSLLCMILRMLHSKPIYIKGTIVLLFTSFYLNYFANLAVGRVNYFNNMLINIITGSLTCSGWILWYFITVKFRSYAYKILVFHLLFILLMGLELCDFPPIFWIFDPHSLWHLTSVPLSFLFYSFIIDDCVALRPYKFKN